MVDNFDKYPSASNNNVNDYSQVTLSTSSEKNAARGTADNASAILTGTDIVSPIASPLPSEENNANEANISAVVPHQAPYAFENPKDYFCYRNGLIETALNECISTLIFPEEDGAVVGSWLLTEITLWDNEKERIVILTKRAIITIKYDFIALKKLEFRRVDLLNLDTVVIGDLVYPKTSLVPHLNGVATGVSTVVRECILDRLSPPNMATKGENIKLEGYQFTDSNTKMGPFDMKHFKSRDRNMTGIRVMWNRGQPLNFMQMWNPFNNNTPFNTFTSHPLFYQKDGPQDQSSQLYDVGNFAANLIDVIEEIQIGESCKVQHAPIVLQSYVGFTSLVHNKTSLGFFKVRGKFSF